RDTLQAEDHLEFVVSSLGATAIESLRDVPGVRSLEVRPTGDGCFHVVVSAGRGRAAAPALIRRIVELGGDVWSAEQGVLTLDEIFSLLMRGEHHGRASGWSEVAPDHTRVRDGRTEGEGVLT